MTESRTVAENIMGKSSALTSADVIVGVLKHRRILLVLPLSMALLIAAVGLTSERRYTATASFYPQERAGERGVLAGVAAEFGLGGVGGSDVYSSDFYVRLMRSRTLLERVVRDTFVINVGSETGAMTLVDLYGGSGGSEAVRREEAAKQLRRDLKLAIVRETGVVEVGMTAATPQLAVAILEALLGYVNAYDVASRQTTARAQREFVEGRLTAAHQELTAAEDRLESFLTENRGFANSPQLQFAHDRLVRVVQARQQVYQGLLLSFEDARIDEVRNTPVIAMVEHPAAPARPDSRRIAVNVVLALLLGLALAVMLIVARTAAASVVSTNSQSDIEVERILAEARADARRPWRMLSLR
jgi:uncharacterized protein involved in exopolysaccharide biosynthesis